MSNDSHKLSQDESGAEFTAENLLPFVYEELRQMAARQLMHEGAGQTLQATALVHEALLRLVGNTGTADFTNRRHFFGAAAEAMRRILVDNARRKQRQKHGGGLQRVELEDPVACESDNELLALDAALPRLAAEDPLAADVVKLKYFAGLGREDIATALGRTVHEIRQKWDYARAWLRLALEE